MERADLVKGLGILSASAVMMMTSPASANGFLEEVPAESWSYGAVNSLIEAGKVPDYTVKIPAGRVLSRLELAMIADSVIKNEANLTASEKETARKLQEEYFYDIKKVELLKSLDKMNENDMKKMESTHKGDKGETFTKEEKESLKKAAKLADKFSVGGYARMRHDHFLKDKADGGTQRTTRANMIHVNVQTTYKVNDDWQVHTDLGYRNSYSGFDERKSLSPSEDMTGRTMDTYVTGNMLQNALSVKVGKWNEWNIYGWGMDIDCDFSGVQLGYGKKAVKTYFTSGKMDLWDDALGGTRTREYVTSLRTYWPIDNKNDINIGVSYTSPMQSRYQDPDQGRVFYYYLHGMHRFDKNFAVRYGVINSDAKRDSSNPLANTKTKTPGRWLQVQYKGVNLQNPGTYGITATYRYEPALTWPTVTDWCGLNEKFFRLGVNYVPAKNIMLDTFYTWGREIDTGKRSDLYRFQAQMFF